MSFFFSKYRSSHIYIDPSMISLTYIYGSVMYEICLYHFFPMELKKKLLTKHIYLE